MRELPAGYDVGLVEALEARLFLNAGVPSLEVFQETDRYIHRVQTADFDGDGDLDVAVLAGRAHRSIPGKAVLRILANDGNGQFERVATKRMLHIAIGFAVGDFNGDGVGEIAIGSRLEDGGGTLIRLFELDSAAGRLRQTERVVSSDRLKQFHSVPAGSSGDSLLMLQTSFVNSQRHVEARVLRLGDAGLEWLAPAFSLMGATSEPRIVDADGDEHHDIVITAQGSMPFTTDVHIFHQDPSSPGMFTAAGPVLTIEGGVSGVPLVADVDQDGLPDIIVVSAFQNGHVRLFKATADGYEAPELILERSTDSPFFNVFNIVGSGIGPTGDFEIWVRQSLGFNGRPPGPDPQPRLVRLVRQDDGSFSARDAFFGRFRYHPAQLTNDTVMDFLALAKGFRSGTVIGINLDGTDRPPLISSVRANVFGVGAPNPASTGDRIVLTSVVVDPERIIGEPGGIRRVSYFLDVNGNGVIDEGDRRIARGPMSHFVRTVRAGWPRGTFNVLVQAADIHGNQSAVYCAEQQLTIV